MGLQGIATEIQASGNGRYRFVASTEARDRFRRRIMVAGWKLESFKANPVFLWEHGLSDDLGSEPIGTVPEIGASKYRGKPALVATVVPSDILSPTAERLWAKVEANELRTVSIGARALVDPTFEYDEDGYIETIVYTSHDLQEISLTSVPANVEAVRIAASVFGASRVHPSDRGAPTPPATPPPSRSEATPKLDAARAWLEQMQSTAARPRT